MSVEQWENKSAEDTDWPSEEGDELQASEDRNNPSTVNRLSSSHSLSVRRRT